MGKFQKGNPGGPGRPKDKETLAYWIRLASKDKSPQGICNLKVVASALWELGRLGNLEAIKILLDRIDGKVPQPLEHSGPEGDVIRVTLRLSNDDA